MSISASTGMESRRREVTLWASSRRSKWAYLATPAAFQRHSLLASGMDMQTKTWLRIGSTIHVVHMPFTPLM